MPRLNFHLFGWFAPVWMLVFGVIDVTHGQAAGALICGVMAGLFAMIYAGPWLDKEVTPAAHIVLYAILGGLVAAMSSVLW